ncbi:HigA family addiction module antitoxin [Sphingobacterium daejeonense]|uniref:HigA family addiction module antitoxin n=1 Tax=Sphingobacterium daejeonense TaxID=371142 RepID=A0ABW3RQU3_9SPHI
MLKKTIAQQLEILPTNLSEILKGKRNISPRLAVRLEKVLKISAKYWLNLQMAWDLQNAREEEYA